MNDTIKISKLLALIPALWVVLLDLGLTVNGQPSSYWEGDLSSKNEGNPIIALFMVNHIAGIFIVTGIWIVIILTLGYYLPRRISRIFILFVLFAHSWGATLWIRHIFGFCSVYIFFLFNAIIYVIFDVFREKRTNRNGL